ncbi:MAG TPA: M1 family aminopeptidase [Gemmatimonadaceae bacterium]|nr:M1 family aminopeptidase [Gemmatimonadaceae bacterium]
MRALFILVLLAARSLPLGAQGVATFAPLGAPTPDSLARLVMARFASSSADAFDSVYTDPLGRDVMRSSVQGRALRRADLQRVIWQDAAHAVLLLAGVVYPARDRQMPLDAAAGSDETNRVRRFSGLYEATKSGESWRLARQIPLDTLNFIRAQAIGATITPGKGIDVADTVTLDIGSPYGFAARFNTAARIASMELDGKPLTYDFGGGVFWFAAKPKRSARLVMRYSIAESRTGNLATRDSTKPATTDELPAFGAYHNTDAWLPFYNYDSGNSFARITATVRIPEAYRLTTSLPQTETVANGTRTVVARSMHPQFIVALAYDRDWQVQSSTITTPAGPLRVETFLTPGFTFTHDTLVKVAARVYDVLARRFGEPQAPTRYLAIVANRALGGGGFAVRMNNLVVGGSGAIMLDDAVLAPSYVLAHEISHGWTMNASGFASNMLQEGWATFAEGTMLGEVYGPDVERAFWERQRASYVNGSGGSSFEGRQSILGSPDNGRIHYVKGSWVFRELERTLGRAAFDKGIRDYVAIRRDGRAAGYQQFIRSMSRAAGRDLTPFVMPWLEGKYIPDVEARVDVQRLIVRQKQPDVVFELPLDVALTTPSGVVVRKVHLTSRADTVEIGEVGAVTDARVDPEHYFLLQRHMGELVRFEYPVAGAPDAKTVEITGNFAAKPMPATRMGDVWVVELPLTEGRYIWQWRIDGATPNDQATYAAVPSPGPSALAGVRVVRPLQPVTDAYPK